jgi:hypothetical protein
MQNASNAVPSGLMTIQVRSDSKVGLMMKAAKEWCEKKLLLTCPVECSVANFLTTGYKVIGANEEVRDLNNSSISIIFH